MFQPQLESWADIFLLFVILFYQNIVLEYLFPKFSYVLFNIFLFLILDAGTLLNYLVLHYLI